MDTWLFFPLPQRAWARGYTHSLPAMHSQRGLSMLTIILCTVLFALYNTMTNMVMTLNKVGWIPPGVNRVSLYCLQSGTVSTLQSGKTALRRCWHGKLERLFYPKFSWKEVYYCVWATTPHIHNVYGCCCYDLSTSTGTLDTVSKNKLTKSDLRMRVIHSHNIIASLNN